MFEIAVQGSHTLKGKRIDVKKALSKADMAKMSQDRQGGGGGGSGGGRGGNNAPWDNRGGNDWNSGSNYGGGGGWGGKCQRLTS